MPSPFPGMNPYLELPVLWAEFHSRLIVALSDALMPQLQPNYYVAVEMRSHLGTDNELLQLTSELENLSMNSQNLPYQVFKQ